MNGTPLRLRWISPWLGCLAALGLPACSPKGDAIPDPAETPTASAEDPTDATSAESDPVRETPLVVDLQMENLSPLYKGFFSHEPFVQALASDLAPHVRSRSATVKVIWSPDDSVGAIHLLIPDGESTLAEAGRRLPEERWLEAAPLMPYLGALDGYRSSLGERYDLRILSFGLALEVWDPHSESRCLWPAEQEGGEPPVLGATLSCRDPFGKTEELTRAGDAWPAKIKGDKKARKALAGALGH